MATPVTGSAPVSLEEALRRASRLVPVLRERAAWELHRRLSYRVPLRCLAGWDLAAPLIGMAQGAVDEFTARLRGTSGPGRTADSVALQALGLGSLLE